MPSPANSDDEEDVIPTKPKQAPKAASPTTTPRRATPAKRPNGKPTTPIKKASPAPSPAGAAASNPKTPNTAPAYAKTEMRKQEPSLLGDFLLGRPSPARRAGAGAKPRRRSLDVVKKELRLEEQTIGKIQQPGGVKDRVKQWQKASAAAGGLLDNPNIIDGEEEEQEEQDGRSEADGIEERSVGEEDRLRIKMRDGKRPGRRKSKGEEEGDGKEKERVKSAPKKRVISDDHWMKPKKRSPPRKAGTLPRDFLKMTTANPPLESKIQDWVKRTGGEEITLELEEKPTSRKVSRQNISEETTPRKRKTSPRSRNVSKQGLPDDGARIKPSPDAAIHDGIRKKPSKENPIDDDIRVRTVRKQESKIRQRDHETEEVRTPRKTSERHLMPPDSERREDDATDWETNVDEDSSFVTPSRSPKSRRKIRRSGSPESIDEIPFGNSAFSVLDLPVGAEAGTLRQPPKRNSSFAMPKVLKKVYNEGMKIARDTVDPQRAGPNHPPSIESWLKGTTDPFVEPPSATPPPSSKVAEGEPRRCSYNEDDATEKELTADTEGGPHEKRRKHRVRNSQDFEESSQLKQDKERAAVESRKTRNTLPSMENSPPPTPSGLRRSPATRNASSPKSARKVPLKEVLMDAFRGESAPILPKTFSKPLADISGSGDNRGLPELKMPGSFPNSPPTDHATFDNRKSRPDEQLPTVSRRTAPTTGEHRLSTIASVETLSTSSSFTETASEFSQTTLTQDTVLTGPTSSSLSRNSKKSGLKRRLTKHSDLISMLSLPDTTAPGRAKSIRSARSVRTSRTQLEKATIQDLLRELTVDEGKYMRELKTLVDGVIPVLLTCVLSRSDSAIAAGLFNPDDTSDSADASFTKPIVDMGISLERLRSLHRRIPLQDPNALVAWAQSSHKTYLDYLTAWRMGFQDVVVNLEPASRRSSAEEMSTFDEVPRNANGDVVDANGERVDVAFLLKRPLVRAKYLFKILKGVDKLHHTQASEQVANMYEDLQILVRRRMREEEARIVDRAANNTDATRARDLKTLALVEDVKVDRTRQVAAKDFFSLDLQHSSGQRLECQVELLFRDKPSDKTDPGDLLVCAVDDNSRWLLFPPFSSDSISACIGDHAAKVVVMVRGVGKMQKWHECFTIETDDPETASDWVEMLGSLPVPPPISRNNMDVHHLPSNSSASGIINKNLPVSLNPPEVEIPIGERRRREAEEPANNRKERRQTSAHTRIASTLPHSIKEESVISDVSPRDLNDAMNKAGQTPTQRARPSRYHERSQQTSPLAQSPSIKEMDESSYDVDSKMPIRPTSSQATRNGTMDSLHIPKLRPSSAPTTPKSSSPLKESMRPEAGSLKMQQPMTPTRDGKAAREDGAPIPPVHKVQTTPNNLKKTPILDSPTPKARRSSSPLKHEYQPSEASVTSPSEPEPEYSEDESSYSESSDEDLEGDELPEVQPGVSIYGKRVSPSGSIYSLPNSTIAPSASASQGPYRGAPIQRKPIPIKKLTATISSWSNKKGRWEDLYGEPCSIIVTPGRIEAWEMSAAHSALSPDLNDESYAGSDVSKLTDAERPLISVDLTPIVSLRQSTALDIEIQSPPRPESRLVCSSTIRYRTITDVDCQQLYSAIHRARLENPKWKKLEEERNLNSYGTHAYEAAIKGNRRRFWLGRKKSYRASARAPSTVAESEQSAGSNSSAFSALKRLGGGGIFNIGKSSIENSQGISGHGISTNSSDTSGLTPPRTPTSPSLASSSWTWANSGRVTNLGSENLKIRLYDQVSGTKWNDRGYSYLTVTAPPPGMRQASTLNNGMERRVIVTVHPIKPSITPDIDSTSASVSNDVKNQRYRDMYSNNTVVLDVVLGANCFSKIGSVGIACNVWEDIVGDNGEVGMASKRGGVSGRTRKWLLQAPKKRDAEWIYSLVAVGR